MTITIIVTTEIIIILTAIIIQICPWRLWPPASTRPTLGFSPTHHHLIIICLIIILISPVSYQSHHNLQTSHHNLDPDLGITWWTRPAPTTTCSSWRTRSSPLTWTTLRFFQDFKTFTCWSMRKFFKISLVDEKVLQNFYLANSFRAVWMGLSTLWRCRKMAVWGRSLVRMSFQFQQQSRF